MGSGCSSVGRATGSNPVIDEKYIEHFCCQLYWKGENKEKEAGIGPFLKKRSTLYLPWKVGKLFVPCVQIIIDLL